MFERFTTQARAVVIDAQHEARELGHRRVGTQHVLLAMARAPDSAGGRVLATLGLEPVELFEAVTSSVGEEGTGFSDEDAHALRSVGIDLDEVRRTVEEAFGPGALDDEVAPSGDNRRATSRSRAARRRRSSSLSARRSTSGIGTSGPSTSCSGWSGTNGARQRRSWPVVASTRTASVRRLSGRSRAATIDQAAQPEGGGVPRLAR